MKKSIFAFAIIGSMFLVSCGAEEADTNEGTEQSNENSEDDVPAPSIVGTWQLSEMDMGEEIPEEEMEMYEEVLNSTIENTKYVFNDDGTFKVTSWMLGSTFDYTGTYATDGETLTMTEEEGDTVFSFSVTENELVLKQDDEGTILTFTFTRE